VVSGSVGTGQRAALATRHVPPALPNGPPVLRHAVLWIADNVPTSAPVLADRRVAGALRARSFADLLPVTFGPADGTPAYVVETRAIRAAAAHRAAVRTALAASAPVARFGGAGGIVVRQHVDVGAARLARLQAADQRARQALEGGLLRDAALTVSATARRILSAGVLDLRAATALSLLARRGPVRLVAVPVVRPERAAGLPARVRRFGCAARSRPRPYSSCPCRTTRRRFGSWAEDCSAGHGRSEPSHLHLVE
jgi:hypothetical protein